MKTTIVTMILAVLMAVPSFVSAQNNPVPSGYKLKKEGDYKKYEQDVLKCIEWYDNTPINKYPAIRQEVAQFLIAWHEGTPYVSIMLSQLAIEGMTEDKSLLVTFMNGWSKFVINGGDESNQVEAYLSALNYTLDVYSNPANGFGKSKHFDKLIKAREKGKLKEMVEKEVSAIKQ